MEHTRFIQGMEQLKAIDGKGGEKVIETFLQCIPYTGFPKVKQRYFSRCHFVQNGEKGHYNPFSLSVLHPNPVIGIYFLLMSFPLYFYPDLQIQYAICRLANHFLHKSFQFIM